MPRNLNPFPRRLHNQPQARPSNLHLSAHLNPRRSPGRNSVKATVRSSTGGRQFGLILEYESCHSESTLGIWRNQFLALTQEQRLHLRMFSITCFKPGAKLNGDLAEAVSASTMNQTSSFAWCLGYA